MHQAIERLAFGRRTTAAEATIPWHTAVLVGRLLLSSIFILSALSKIAGFEGTVGYVESQGLTPGWLFAGGAIAVELVGGLSILTGTFARFGAVALFAFTGAAALIFHDFWTFDGQERQMEMTNFLKNLSIMGGLLLVVGYGAGKPSVDEKLAGTAQDRHAVS